MNIHEGGSYKTREGKIVGPLTRSVNPSSGLQGEQWPWCVKEPDGWTHWDSQGRFVPGKESILDLVEELKPLDGLAKPLGMTKKRLLDLASEAVADRGLNYGSPEDNFRRIAELWSVHLRNRVPSTAGPHYVSPGDVAQMMILMKIARLENSPGHQDSWIDLAGYAACGAEIELSASPKNKEQTS